MGRTSKSDKFEQDLIERLTKALEDVIKATEKWNGVKIKGIALMIKEIADEKTKYDQEKTKRKLSNDSIKREREHNKTKIESKRIDEQLIKLRHRLKMDLEDEHGHQVRENIKLRNSMDNFHSALNFVTSSLTKGVGIGTVFGKLSIGAANVTKAFNEIQRAKGKVSGASAVKGLLQDQLDSSGSKNETKYWQMQLQHQEKIVQQAQTALERAEKTQGADMLQHNNIKKIARNLNKAGQYFEKHKTGILLGVGTAGVFIGIIKKALDVSPMFQAMMKLFKTTVTFILRPIGDFFGFLLKPILLLLLRNFVLPWFRHVFPVMRELGTKFGKVGADVIGKLSKGDIIGALFATAPLFTSDIIKDAIFGEEFKLFGDDEDSILTNIAAMGLALGGAVTAFKGAKSAMNIVRIKLITLAREIAHIPTPKPTPKPTPSGGTTSGAPVTTPKPPTPSGGSGKFVGGTTTGDGEFMGRDKHKGTITESIKGQTKLEKILSRLSSTMKRDPLKAIKQIPSLIGKYGKNAFIGALTSGRVAGGGGRTAQMMWAEMLIGSNILAIDDVQKIWSKKSWFPEWQSQRKRANENYGFDPEIGGHPFSNPVEYANGGIINEPINGIGLNSGKSYSFGERGREMVTPMSGTGSKGSSGGVVVNINISNMSGDRNDVEKLRKTILDVMHESNIYRGRV